MEKINLELFFYFGNKNFIYKITEIPRIIQTFDNKYLRFTTRSFLFVDLGRSHNPIIGLLYGIVLFFFHDF